MISRVCWKISYWNPDKDSNNQEIIHESERIAGPDHVTGAPSLFKKVDQIHYFLYMPYLEHPGGLDFDKTFSKNITGSELLHFQIYQIF